MKSVALALIPILLLIFSYFSLYDQSAGLFGSTTTGSGKQVNFRPIIAVMAQPSGPNCTPFGEKYTSYVPASYIEFIESMGARAVPVRFDDTDEHILDLIEKVDGALFPGGDNDMVIHNKNGTYTYTRYYDVLKMFFDASVSKSKQGINFPVMGTCLGFEALAYIVMKDKYLDYCDAEHFAVKQTLINPAETKMYADLPADLKNAAQTEPIIFEAHMRCITMDHFNSSSELNQFFRVTSTALDNKGLEYVNSWESIDYPIYGQQYHPEKNLFDWHTPNIPHGPMAVRWAQYVADFFGDQNRMDPQTFLNKTVEKEELIYNYNPFNTPDGYFEQVYCFEPLSN